MRKHRAQVESVLLDLLYVWFTEVLQRSLAILMATFILFSLTSAQLDPPGKLPPMLSSSASPQHDTSVGWSQRAVDRIAQPAVRSNEAVDGYSRSTVPLMSHPRPLSRVRIRMGVEFV
jgi:hypothetical protein